VLTADSGFTAFSGISTHTLGAVTTTNSKAVAVVGNWSNSTTTFAAPVFINITTNQFAAATTNGFFSGSMLLDAQASGIRQFAVSPTGQLTAQNFTTNSQGLVPSATPGGTAFLRADGVFSTPATVGLTTSQGWINWNGETRLAADLVGVTDTNWRNVMQVNVNAGKTYKFKAALPLRATVSTQGIAMRVGGGATATAVVYDGWIIDSAANGIKGNAQATALSTTVASSAFTGATSHVQLVGTITVNAAGTLILQASAFTTGTAVNAVTIGRGATFMVEDIP
jgi:hypothetical protein